MYLLVATNSKRMTQRLSNITYLGDKIDDFDLFENLPDYLKDFYSVTNGFVAFNGGLHIRGCVLSPKWHSLREYWIGDTNLKELFGSIERDDIPFAQDCFGDQYVIRDNRIWRLSAETDEIENLEISFNDFLGAVETKPLEFLNIEKIEPNTLGPGQIFNVVPPFCVESSEYSFKPLQIEEQIRYLSDFSKQIKIIPDGRDIILKTK